MKSEPSEKTSITIPSASESPEKYRVDLRHAILDTLKLVFERQTLSIEEDECYSIYLLVDLADKL